jgi:hypothetical protein
MTLKTLGAVAILVAAFSSPLFAQDQADPHKSVHALRHYRGTYNEVQQPGFAAPRASGTGSYFDNDTIDRSRIGGHDPDLNPASS